MRSNRRTYLAALASGATGALAGCTAVGSLGLGDDHDPCGGPDSGCDVGMTRNSFVPERYEVSVGERVVWKNTSGAAHTVTAYDDAIPDDAAYFATGGYPDEESAREAWRDREGGIDPGDTFAHAFEVPGTYGYVCIPHEGGGMTGSIVVTE